MIILVRYLIQIKYKVKNMASSDLENNKIFAAVLVAGIIAMLSGFVANKFIPDQELEEDAFPIEVADAPVKGAPVVEAVAEPIADLIAMADVARGQKLSKACAACHSFDNGGPNKIGPNLWNTYNNKKGHIASFGYSDALLAKGGVWDVENLNAFLWKPKKYIPGTKMNYAGMRKPEDRAAIVKYIQTLR
jgi:cytochrome c